MLLSVLFKTFRKALNIAIKTFEIREFQLQVVRNVFLVLKGLRGIWHNCLFYILLYIPLNLLFTAWPPHTECFWAMVDKLTIFLSAITTTKWSQNSAGMHCDVIFDYCKNSLGFKISKTTHVWLSCSSHDLLSKVFCL